MTMRDSAVRSGHWRRYVGATRSRRHMMPVPRPLTVGDDDYLSRLRIDEEITIGRIVVVGWQHGFRVGSDIRRGILDDRIIFDCRRIGFRGVLLIVGLHSLNWLVGLNRLSRFNLFLWCSISLERIVQSAKMQLLRLKDWRESCKGTPARVLKFLRNRRLFSRHT